jgi:hypothetical protein
MNLSFPNTPIGVFSVLVVLKYFYGAIAKCCGDELLVMKPCGIKVES